MKFPAQSPYAQKLQCPVCKYHIGYIVPLTSRGLYYWLCPNCESYDVNCYDTIDNAVKGFLAGKKNGALKKRLHLGNLKKETK